MRALVSLLLAAPLLAILPTAADAKVRINVDLDAQTIHIESKEHVFDWKVSSGAIGYGTPAGTYGVLWTNKDHHSDEYDGAPMPNSIFFRPGFAIHGAYKSDWGRPASHGCVRLPVAKSAILFDLVKAEGAQITITGGEAMRAPAEARSTGRPGAGRLPAVGEAARANGDDARAFRRGSDETLFGQFY